LTRVQISALAAATWDELPAENWMVDRLTTPELKAKLAAEKAR
jgi:hypothetical protein